MARLRGRLVELDVRSSHARSQISGVDRLEIVCLRKSNGVALKLVKPTVFRVYDSRCES